MLLSDRLRLICGWGEAVHCVENISVKLLVAAESGLRDALACGIPDADIEGNCRIRRNSVSEIVFRWLDEQKLQPFVLKCEDVDGVERHYIHVIW